MENRRKNIKLSKYFFNQINSRSSIDLVIKRLKKGRNYSVDFSDIDFLSRAAAHQLVSLQNKLSNEGIDLTYVNVSNHVNSMIEKVEKSATNSVKHATFVKYLNIREESELKNFLMQV
ncbi:STAS domain-containing protein [Anaerophaga thermohalophila]|jgi:anti-anti-sigma regulatory factor|uniref:STAS domain-containing protein n=1 Tax=Anaerophaga thermohalophila TaxID=177400 RepID=UPI00037BC482|nr:STAS domain-containing protein [Anaerophaga thermohalophila]